MITVAALLGLMGLTWGAAIWASFSDETETEARSGKHSSRQAFGGIVCLFALILYWLPSSDRIKMGLLDMTV